MNGVDGPGPGGDLAVVLLTLGSFFLVGLITDIVGRRTRLPRVTLLLLFGFAAGPSAFDLLPDIREAWFPAVADMTLVMIGFLLGGTLTRARLRALGRTVFGVSVGVVAATALVTFAGLRLLGLPFELALMLAAIAPATDPVATAAVVQESGADNPFTRTLLGIVAIDDVWGLIVFSILLAVALALGGGTWQAMITHGLYEIGGALALGAALGVPMAYLTGRIQPGEPTQVEALGLVLICGGLALWLQVSFLLAAMVMGAAVANLARHHRRPFHAIEGIEWPFMVLFFVLAGASLDLRALHGVGALALAFVVLRVIGRLAGAWCGGLAAGVDGPTRLWMGWALLPQAGVALGMGLVAVQRFPEFRDQLLPVIIAATVLFELLGPVCTAAAVRRTAPACTSPGHSGKTTRVP